MLNAQTIGALSLNISFFFYLIFYFPQLLHNAFYKRMAHLSFLMHATLWLASIADLIYGFGRHMQWQYRVVTIVSLICLAIQQVQFCWYGKKAYRVSSCIFSLLFLFAIISIHFSLFSLSFLLIAGSMSQLGNAIYAIPQLLKNQQLQCTDGVSFYFILLSILLNTCDSISAWALHWDFPNKIGSPLGLLFSLLLLIQYYRYQPKTQILSTTSPAPLARAP